MLDVTDIIDGHMAQHLYRLQQESLIAYRRKWVELQEQVNRMAESRSKQPQGSPFLSSQRPIGHNITTKHDKPHL